MDHQQILNLYEWESGVCFRHPGKGEVRTAVVEIIRPTAGGIQEVRACMDCVVQMVEERRARATRAQQDRP